MNALLRESGKKSKKVPKLSTREEAIAFLLICLKDGRFFTPVKRVDKIRLLPIVTRPEDSRFTEDGYYAILYEGSKLMMCIQGLGILTCVFSFVVIQLWPEKPRKIAYYSSIGILCLMGVIAVISMLRYLINVLCKLLLGMDLWILPGLYEDVSLKENFIPLYKIYRNDDSKDKSKTVEEPQSDK